MRLLDESKPLIDAMPQLKTTVDFFMLYFNILTHNRAALHFPGLRHSILGILVPESFTSSDPCRCSVLFAVRHLLLIFHNLSAPFLFFFMDQRLSGGC